jgi:lipoprotein-anchoring transpeptidase ErfK/SrfK
MSRGPREGNALRAVRRALQASSPAEALWWTAQAYRAAPTHPAVRALVRRMQRRYPNARGRPPLRWHRLVLASYALLSAIALVLILYGPQPDHPLEPPAAAHPPVEMVAEAGTPEKRPGETLASEGATPSPASESPTPSPTPTATPVPPTPTARPSPTATPIPPTPTATPTASPSPTASPTRRPAPMATPRPRLTASPTPMPGPPFPGRWILVDLSDQELIAYEGEAPILRTKVSTGRRHTPTVVGTFHIYLKLRSRTMRGPDYYLPNVPYVMYFYKGYALHGTYWHNNFGQPMSRGCVNLPTPIAAQLYQWADIGTPVVVQP